MTVIEGVDYAFPPIPSPAALVAAGKKFAVRYGGKGTTDKMLTAAELARLRAAGIDVVANVEGAAGGFRGWSAGANWAQAGLAWFGPLGMPSDRPIYFSVDWDAGSGDWAAIDAALQGAASVIGAARVGVYGSYRTIRHCQAAGTARWFWQTYAWSNGQWATGTHLQQYRNGVRIGGADCDLTRAVADDFGQWNYQEADVNLTDNEGSKAWPGRTIQDFILDVHGLRDVLRGDPTGTKVAAYPADSPLMELLGTPAAVTALSAKLDALEAEIKAAGQVTITQAQLDAAVLNALKTLAGGSQAAS